MDSLTDKVGNCLNMEIQISPDFRENLYECANTKYGCRFIESKIRNVAMKAYLRVIKEKIDMDNRFVCLTGEDGFLIKDKKTNEINMPCKPEKCY